MSFKDTFSYQTSPHVEIEVNGKPVRFYPTRYCALAHLAKVSKPMVTALTALFVENGREEGATTEKMRDVEGTEIEKVSITPITAELAAHKSSERKAAIESIFSCVEDFQNRYSIGVLLMDSMRDEFPYKKERSPKEVSEFLDGDEKDYTGIDLPTLAQLVQGFVRANAKVFGSQGEELVGAVKARLAALRENSPLSQAETDPTVGGSSKTA